MQTQPPITIHVGNNSYATIQDAIDAANNASIIYVNNGIYHENIIINKTISLIGENITMTIIDGNYTGDVIHISSTVGVNIKGFTIRNAGNAGINIHSNHNTITANNISNNKYGIYSAYSQYNNFSHNTFISNSDHGIYFYSGSNNNVIFDNVFSTNPCGLRIKASSHNEISRNLFTDNQKGMYFCCASQYNTAFHNIFINNTIWNADDYIDGNQWDNGKEGNHWDDYTGSDTNRNGIGDTPYTVHVNTTRQDNYPLMIPQ